MKSSEVKIFSVILVFAVVLVGFAVAPIIMGGWHLVDVRKPEPMPGLSRQLLVTPGSHVRGDPKAPTTIVVFSDFQCPSCREGAPLLDGILDKKKGQVKEVFHHFQVKPEHVYSQVLSRAAEAAGEQGEDKFWKMHDVLFNKQKDLVASSSEDQVREQLREYAKALGLDMIRFDASMLKKTGDAKFAKDNELGIKVDIKGTPTYFVIDPAGKVTRYSSNAGIQAWADGTTEKPAQG